MKKKEAFLSAAVLLCTLGLFYLLFATPLLRPSDPGLAVRTQGKEIQLLQNGSWQPFEVRGVNMGSAAPGLFPNEGRISRQTYLEWFGLIRDMHAHDHGGDGVAAEHGGVEHLCKAQSGVVEFVVAHGGSVVAHSAHGPQLCRLGGVEGLDQGADGHVSAVHRQCVGVFGPLPLQGGHEPGVASRLAAVLSILGQKVGVQVVGKENGRLLAALGCLLPCRPDGQQKRTHHDKSHQQTVDASNQLQGTPPAYVAAYNSITGRCRWAAAW